jgi:hypothetical protein
MNDPSNGEVPLRGGGLCLKATGRLLRGLPGVRHAADAAWRA